jgi:hypothetical protein
MLGGMRENQDTTVLRIVDEHVLTTKISSE